MSEKTTKRTIRDSSEVTSPRVTRVTPEGRLLYDPISVIRSKPARKHLNELEKKSSAESTTTKR